mmetsp:Transcript_118289/g.331318  ORF Transcript_118289/g.331318 Transcript_118289/m.331318 type:complete len:276 (-) Transcript_118289:1058-1885(-)
MHVHGHETLYLSSRGTQRLLAPIFRPPIVSSSAASSLLLFLIISSHSFSPQNGTKSILPLLRLGLKSFQASIDARLASRSATAFEKSSSWISCKTRCTSSVTCASLPKTLPALVSKMFRLAMTNWPFWMSMGPTSNRIGTPFISQWLNFQPGEWSDSSSLTRTPADDSLPKYSMHFSRTSSRSASEEFALRPTGTMTTWKAATRGGSTRPLSSPWTMAMTPIVRCVMPQEFWKANSFFFPVASDGSWNVMSNIFENFWPRWCDVAPWIARPVAGM